MVDCDAAPEELQQRNRWVCWTYEERDGRQTKPPIAPFDGRQYASTDDPDTWKNYNEVITYHQRPNTDTAGIGFVLSSSGGIAGADLDGCREPVTGAIEPWARSVVDTLDSYTEVSPSGTGLRVFVIGSLPEGRNRAEQPRTLDQLQKVAKGSEIELYDTDRYLTFTGNRLDGAPTGVYSRSDELETVHREYVGTDDEGAATSSSTASTPPNVDVTFDDRELLAKARNAANGKKFSRLYDDGNTSGYNSHSEADAALCSMLAFWTCGDRQQVDRLFRSSGLMRAKWDEDRGSQTYGELTIRNASRVCSEYYTGETETSNVFPEPDPAAVGDGGRPVVSWPTLCRVGEVLADRGCSTTEEIAGHAVVDRSETQVRRALKYLESVDVVCYQRDGRSVTYRLSNGTD